MTRRMTTLKWVFYALWTLVFLLVQQLVFPYLRIAGVHPFILPSLAAIAASFEGKREGPVYALVLDWSATRCLPARSPASTPWC